MQRTYRRNFAKAYAGMLSGTGVPRVRSIKNSSLARAEVWQVTIPATPAASTAFSLTVEGRVVSFTTDATPTQAELAQGILSAIRQSDIYDFVKVTLNTAGNIIFLERKILGIPLAVVSATLAVARVTAASNATMIPFGSVIVAGGNAGQPGDNAAGTMVTSGVSGSGIVMATHASEKVGIGPNALSGVQPLEVMDVVTRTLSLEGIWTRYAGPAGTTQVADQPVYQCWDAGNEGAVSIVSANAPVVLPGAVFASNVEIDPNGGRIALVALG